MAIVIPDEFYEVLPDYVGRMTHGNVMGFNWQKYMTCKDCPGDGSDCDKCHGSGWVYGFWRTPELLTISDWEFHFYKGPRETKREKIGCLGLKGRYKDDILKYLMIDLDTQELVDIDRELISPYLKKDRIESIFEMSGTKEEPRGHRWILMHCNQQIAENYINQMIKDIGVSKVTMDEIYNVNEKRDGIARQPYGPHIRRNNTRYPIIHRGQMIGEFDPRHEKPKVIEVIKAFNELEVIPEEYILSLTRDEFRYQQRDDKKEKKEYSKDKPFYYFPQKLEQAYPLEELPRGLVKVARSCPALTEMLRRTKEEKILNQRGQTYHDWGFFFTRLCMYSDIVLKRDDGKKFAMKVFKETRTRPYDSHQFDSEYERMKRDPNTKYPGCKAMERFELCDGCALKGIHTTRRIIEGTALPIEREVLEDVTYLAKTPQEIRETTFVEIKKHLDMLVHNGLRENMLIASPQQAGKSFLATELATRYNNRTIIVVPTADVAYEYQDRLENIYGVKSFILGSQKTLFKGNTRGPSVAKKPCPYQEEIDKLSGLGIQNSQIKSRVCARCPMELSCPWMVQYKEVMEDKHNIVIIQHAHLGIRSVMAQLSKKKFDIAIIDESFLENCIGLLRPSYKEKKVLGSRKYQWCKDLLDWFRTGNRPDRELTPADEELDEIKAVFQKAKLGWKIPEYILAFNSKASIDDPQAGIKQVFPPPYAPIRLLLDATPPKQLTAMVTGLKNIQVYGEKEVIDYVRLHSDNEVIQVLDSTVSKTNLERNDLFYECLAKIAFLMQSKFAGKKGVITCYKGWEDKVDEYFQLHPQFQEVRTRLSTSRMERGTNKWKDYDVQFILASVNFTGKEYYQNKYIYTMAWNHHQRMEGHDEISNPFPYDAFEPTSEDKLISAAIEAEPVERLEYENGRVVRVRYPQFFNYPPQNELFRLDYQMNIGAFQQSNRMRFDDQKGRSVYFFGNQNMDGIIIRRTVTMARWLDDLTL